MAYSWGKDNHVLILRADTIGHLLYAIRSFLRTSYDGLLILES